MVIHAICSSTACCYGVQLQDHVNGTASPHLNIVLIAGRRPTRSKPVLSTIDFSDI
jgi:hypothetical protein